MHLVFILYRNVCVYIGRVDHTEQIKPREIDSARDFQIQFIQQTRKIQKLNINYFFNNSTP